MTEGEIWKYQVENNDEFQKPLDELEKEHDEQMEFLKVERSVLDHFDRFNFFYGNHFISLITF